MYYVYVLQSTRNSERFYLGSTTDLRERLKSHNRGENKATRGSQWQLVYYEAYLTLASARDREHRLKHDGRAKRYLMQRIKASL
jgi:putative endonuclease